MASTSNTTKKHSTHVAASKSKRLTVSQVNSDQFAHLVYAFNMGIIDPATFRHKAIILGSYWENLATFHINNTFEQNAV